MDKPMGSVLGVKVSGAVSLHQHMHAALMQATCGTSAHNAFEVLVLKILVLSNKHKQPDSDSPADRIRG